MLDGGDLHRVARELRAEGDAVKAGTLREIPTWPRTGMVEWQFLPAQQINAGDGAFSTPARWRAQALTQLDGQVFVAQLEIAESDIEVHRADLLTFISTIVHEAHMALVENVERYLERENGAH